jgi:hypothetical protein
MLNKTKIVTVATTSTTAVLRIRDVLSQIPDPDPTIDPSRIRIPDPGGKKHRIPDPTYFCIRLLTNFVNSLYTKICRIRDQSITDPGSGG